MRLLAGSVPFAEIPAGGTSSESQPRFPSILPARPRRLESFPTIQQTCNSDKFDKLFVSSTITNAKSLNNIEASSS